MVTRANLAEPAERTTTSSPAPTIQRDVSFVRVGASTANFSPGSGAALTAAGRAGEQPGAVGQPGGRASRLRDDRGRRAGHRVLLDSGAPALHGRIGRRVRQSRAISRAGDGVGSRPVVRWRRRPAARLPVTRLVRRLVLCGTGPGLGGLPGTPAALQELASPARYYSAARSRRATPLIYGGRFAREPERSTGAAATPGRATFGLRLLLPARRTRRLEQPALVGTHRGSDPGPGR